jgi:hypothetical protein
MSARPVPLPAKPDGASAFIPEQMLKERGAYLDCFLEARTWPERLAVLDSWFRAAVLHDADLDHTALVLTADLEQLAEREIASIMQAALYRISVHADWRAAAARFLDGVHDPDALAWLGHYPGVLTVVAARMAGEAGETLPATRH